MSNTNYTPGPWGDLTLFNNQLTIGIDWPEGDDRDHYLAEITSGDPEELRANAALIQAAPDLYEALKLAMPALKHLRTQFPRHPNDDSIDVLKLAMAAVAKAEGKE